MCYLLIELEMKEFVIKNENERERERQTDNRVDHNLKHIDKFGGERVTVLSKRIKRTWRHSL